MVTLERVSASTLGMLMQKQPIYVMHPIDDPLVMNLVKGVLSLLLFGLIPGAFTSAITVLVILARSETSSIL
jgi:hypothetical protein